MNGTFAPITAWLQEHMRNTFPDYPVKTAWIEKCVRARMGDGNKAKELLEELVQWRFGFV